MRKAIRVLCAGLVAGSVAAASVATTSVSASAASAPRLIRDAEIENTIRAFSSPVFEAAGLNARDVDIYLVNDPSINAFVAGGMNMFLHTGLLLRSKTANQVIGVIAHETGHISGGHLARLQDRLKDASLIAILTTILGAGAAVAGGGSAGAAVMTGGMSVAQNTILSYSRAQEAAADQAGLSFLEQTGQSAKGMHEFFEVLEGQELLNAGRQDPYMRTHPLNRERMESVESHLSRSRYTDAPDTPEFAELHRRMLAKLVGFVASPSHTLNRYKEGDRSIAARYARAIAYYRTPDMPKALAMIDELIAQEPNNAYFYELKGQALFENGRGAEALAPYRKSVALMPDEALLRVGLAQVMIERNDPVLNKEAIGHLQRATQREPLNGFAWQQLAIAYGRDEQFGMSALAQAEAAMTRNNKREARLQGGRAEKLLPRGSRGWLRAQDLLAAARKTDE